MGRMGKADFRELKALQQRLEKLSKVDFNRFYQEAAEDIAGRLLAKVKKRTPVVYGKLRDAWAVLPIERQGDQYIITVINSLRYASYVEYGHRQRPGRFIPGHWEGERFIYNPDEEGGMVLKNAWVEGRFMLTISVQELERMTPALLERRLTTFLKGCLDAE
ncbi:MAG: type I neck protein [Chaetfec virus UA24_244]|nr:MAG: type I neck protein [Chaetfec virus UA24_244]